MVVPSSEFCTTGEACVTEPVFPTRITGGARKQGFRGFSSLVAFPLTITKWFPLLVEVFQIEVDIGLGGAVGFL